MAWTLRITLENEVGDRLRLKLPKYVLNSRKARDLNAGFYINDILRQHFKIEPSEVNLDGNGGARKRRAGKMEARAQQVEKMLHDYGEVDRRMGMDHLLGKRTGNLTRAELVKRRAEEKRFDAVITWMRKNGRLDLDAPIGIWRLPKRT